MKHPSLARRLTSEALGTALLLATVVGSGIMAERLSAGNVALALLANTIATGVARRHAEYVPFAVGAYITAAYWFTASTSFANPAVTLARAASSTFAGIRPADAPGFIVAQLVGALGATLLFRWLAPAETGAAERVPADRKLETEKEAA